MRRISTWICGGVGAGTFMVTHLLTSTWWDRLGGLHEPWFLNSGRAAFLTATALFVVGGVAGAVARSMRTSAVCGIAAGIGAASTALLTLVQIGPGTIFPIAATAGTLLLVASSLAGAMLAAGTKSGWTKWSKGDATERSR